MGSALVLTVGVRKGKLLEIRHVNIWGCWVDGCKIRYPACSWIRNLWFAVVEVARLARVAVEHDQIRVAEGRNKHSVLFLINGYLATRDYAGEGIAESVREGSNRHLRRRTGEATRHVGCITGGTIKNCHLHSEAIHDKDGIRIEQHADRDRRIADRHNRFGGSSPSCRDCCSASCR